MPARGPIQIILAGDPVGKGRPRFVRATGHAFTPSRTRAYEGALRYAAQRVMQSCAPLAGPLSVVLVAIFPIPASWSGKKRAAALAGEIWPTMKPDADNLLKTMDALNGIVFDDDKQIVDARIVKRYGERPRLIIEVREIETQPTTQPATANGTEVKSAADISAGGPSAAVVTSERAAAALNNWGDDIPEFLQRTAAG